MKKRWILKNGATESPCDSFPYAFRAMFMTIKRAREKGQNVLELAKQFKIVSPFGKIYSHSAATQMALDQGLLTASGEINGREFKRRP